MGGFGIWSGTKVILGSMSVIKGPVVLHWSQADLGLNSASACMTFGTMGFKYTLHRVNEEMYQRPCIFDAWVLVV